MMLVKITRSKSMIKVFFYSAIANNVGTIPKVDKGQLNFGKVSPWQRWIWKSVRNSWSSIG